MVVTGGTRGPRQLRLSVRIRAYEHHGGLLRGAAGGHVGSRSSTPSFGQSVRRRSRRLAQHPIGLGVDQRHAVVEVGRDASLIPA
jgi:hypothetical protein